MSGSRSNLILRVLNTDLSDHTSLQRTYKDLMLDLIELGAVGFGGDKFYLDASKGDDRRMHNDAEAAVRADREPQDNVPSTKQQRSQILQAVCRYVEREKPVRTLD